MARIRKVTPETRHHEELIMSVSAGPRTGYRRTLQPGPGLGCIPLSPSEGQDRSSPPRTRIGAFSARTRTGVALPPLPHPHQDQDRGTSPSPARTRTGVPQPLPCPGLHSPTDRNAADNMPVAVTQEDFLVTVQELSSLHVAKFLGT